MCGGRKAAAGKRLCCWSRAIFTAASHLEPVFEPVIEQAGFKLVRLRIMGGAAKTLQIMAERADGSMDVEGCTQLSHALLDFIEAEDPIEGEYEIEVSSPGIDRPLTRMSDFTRWKGHEAKIELTAPLPTRMETASVSAASWRVWTATMSSSRRRARAYNFRFAPSRKRNSFSPTNSFRKI